MNWYWKVRIYSPAGGYWHGQVATGRSLHEIDGIQDFYKALTGCKMLLEGMNAEPYEGLVSIREAFDGLWGKNGA